MKYRYEFKLTDRSDKVVLEGDAITLSTGEQFFLVRKGFNLNQAIVGSVSASRVVSFEAIENE